MVRSLVAWSLGIGLAWLLLGQQPVGQLVGHLDLTAGLPGAAPVHQQPAAPARPGPAPRQQAPAPRRQTSPQSYDCSGLTWLAWQHAGLSWERMSAAGQWQWLDHRGQDIPARQLGPGDLLFYANDPHDPASIHHVAMHVGHGRMVEAPEPGIPVRVVPVRWRGLYAAARPA